MDVLRRIKMLRYIANAIHFYLYRSNKNDTENISNTLNIFEGFRRIIKVIAIIWIVSFAVAAFTVKPHVSHTYLINGFEAEVLSEDITNKCDVDSRKLYSDFETSSGNPIKLIFCFKTRESDGERYIPFKREDKTGDILAGRENSKEVTEYLKKYVENFVVKKNIHENLDYEYRIKLLKELAEGFVMMLAGLAFLFISTWCIGYIVRGFMGVALGSDIANSKSVKESE